MTKIVDLTDNELVCAYQHGWSAKHYLGHGMMDRARETSRRLEDELTKRGFNHTALDRTWSGQCDCDVPRFSSGCPINI